MFRKSKLSKLSHVHASHSESNSAARKEDNKAHRTMPAHGSTIYVPKRMPAPKRKKPRISLAFAVLMAFIIFCSASLGMVISISSKFALLETLLTMMSTSGFVGETNILVIGLDAGRRWHRADTIMVINVNPDDKKVSVVSIPRDTLVNVPGLGLTKINHSFVYGGSKLTKRALERFLNISIPFTVSIDMAGLAKVIDTLGGLNITVEKRMYYVDRAGGLYIDIYPGKQVLSGRKAIGYVRFRSDGRGDFGRISRQQKFVKALANKIIAHKSVLKTPKLIMSLLSNIDTNLSSKQVLGISMSMRQALDLGNIETATIPGSSIMINNVYYLKPNAYETRRIISKMLRRNKARGYGKGTFNLSVIGATL